MHYSFLVHLFVLICSQFRLYIILLSGRICERTKLTDFSAFLQVMSFIKRIYIIVCHYYFPHSLLILIISSNLYDPLVLKSDFKEEPKDQTVFDGDQVVLKCSPPKGRPEPVMSWLKDGVELKLDASRLKLSEPGDLTISQVRKADGGRYRCVAKNAIGEQRSPEAVLTVKGKLQCIFRAFLMF